MVIAKGIRPDTFEYQWVAAVVDAVARRTGVPSRWNRELFEEPLPGNAGSALESGGLTVDREALDLVVKAYQGHQLDDDELETLRQAVTTVSHEAKHLTSWPGDLNAPDAVGLYEPDNVSLEEGLVEDWAQNTVDDVIRDIGMDQVVPGLTGHQPDDTSPAYTAGTDGLISGVSELTGASPEYLRQNIAATGRAQRWSATAQYLVEQRLGDLVPAEHRDAVRGQVMDAMRTQFAPLKALHDSEQSDMSKLIAGHQIGQQTVASLTTTLDGIENHYREHQQQAALQVDPEVAQLRKFLDQPSANHAPVQAVDSPTTTPDNVRPLRAKSDAQKGQSPSL